MQGLNINGEITIYKSQYGYSTRIVHKKQDGSYEGIFIDAQLPKGHELEHKTIILVNKGFLSCNKERLKAVIQEYMVINNTEEPELPF